MVIPRSIGSLVMQPDNTGINDNTHDRVATRRKPEILRLTIRARNCPNIILPPDTSTANLKFRSRRGQVVQELQIQKPHWNQQVAGVLRFRSSQSDAQQQDAKFGFGALAPRLSVSAGPGTAH